MTGVQTCALPICQALGVVVEHGDVAAGHVGDVQLVAVLDQPEHAAAHADDVVVGVGAERVGRVRDVVPDPDALTGAEIGRAKEGSRRPSLRVILVGEVGLRKGAQYLLEALRLCDDPGIEARFVGRCPLSSEIVARYRHVAEFLGPIPRSEVAAQYRWADVFCLPSLCEGSATVIYEAVMQGLAVIATPNAGPPVTSNPYGVIVEPRDATAIAQALGRYREEPDLLAAHRCGALESRDELSRAAYGVRLLDAIRSLELPGAARCS